jgi:dolichol-phosphate mannosyltransferase
MSAETIISLVTPVYNDGETATILVEKVTQLFRSLPYKLEIVIVNDGSDDHNSRLLDALCQNYENVGVLHLARNFGHQAALSAGLDVARGDAVITMDADLQHPVELIPQLVEQWRAGYAVINTVRQGDEEYLGPFKRLTSKGFYRVIQRLSETPILADSADFRLLDRAAVDALRSLPERTRFMRGLTGWIGFRQQVLPFQLQPRTHGVTKFNTGKMVKLALDGIISMSTLPLRFALYLGSGISLLAFAYLLWIFLAYVVTDRAIQGWSSLMVAVLFMGGLQINLLGIVGLYLGKVYEEAKQRPAYLVMRRNGIVR